MRAPLRYILSAKDMLTKVAKVITLLCCATTLVACGQVAPQNANTAPAASVQNNENQNAPDTLNSATPAVAPNIEQQLDQRIAEPAQTTPQLPE